MPNNDLPQGMYSPLSQNMTDSESEEELHRHNHNLKGSATSMMMSNGTRRMSTVNNHAAAAVLGPMHEVNCTNYTNLNSDGEERNTNDADNIRIIGHDAVIRKPMSSVRRILFILSLLVCVLTVILFLWVIPCSEDASCPAKSERIKTENWIRNYEKIELKGAINVVNGLRGRSKNLIFMYRGDKLFNEFETINNPKRNGIISLIGSSGLVAWFDEIANEPKIIDCTLIDVDKNGSPDCLIVDEFGEIGCINPISGQWLWHVSDRTTKTAEFLSFPLILPDLNNDGVYDLLVSASVGQGHYNNLKFISGASGQTIGISFPMSECSFIHKFQLDKHYKISFNCISNDTEIQIVKPLVDLYRLITNKSVDLGISSGTSIVYPPISQHKYYGQRKDTLSQRNIYSVSGKQLIVENYGKCPDNCNVSVQLIEQRDGKDHIIRHFSRSRMYGMVPATLSFNNTGVHGFVLKFWEWSLNDTDFHSQTRNRRSTFTHEYNVFSNILVKKRSWSLPDIQNDIKIQYKRSINHSTIDSGNPLKSFTRFIKETVVLIVFNSTDIRIDNTSQSNIIQFCHTDEDELKTVSCQPDLNYQENSLLIADLDEDESQELVSYYSSFVQHDEDDQNSWKLVTYVQLLRLESELPKLYNDAMMSDRK